MSNTIFWGDNTAAPSNYEVAYSTAYDGVFSSLVKTQNTTYEHLTGEYDDWYKIRSIYQSGTSDWSLPFQPIYDPDNQHCILYGYLRELNMRYASSGVSEIKAVPIRMPAKHLDWGLDLQHPVSSAVDDQGYFQLLVTKNTPVRLEIPQIGYSEDFIVPSASSTDFKLLKPFKWRD